MANTESVIQEVETQRISGMTLVAFVAVVILGGSNAVAVRFSNFELPPFWGATIRFASAAAIFWFILLIRMLLYIGLWYLSPQAWRLFFSPWDHYSPSFSPGRTNKKRSVGGD
jgi:hypothetical protein